MTPRCVAAYLDASFRNEARERLTQAMVSGYVHLDTDVKRSLLNVWAMQARGESLTEEKVDEASGVTAIQQGDIGAWINSNPSPGREG